jgi:hypothetical protein
MNTDNLNPRISKAHVTALNLNSFKIIKAMGLKIIAFCPLE